MRIKLNNTKTIIIVLVILLLFLSFLYTLITKPGNKAVNEIKVNLSLNKCPSDLVGLITYPIMDKVSIKGLVPLGNSNPPGHTFPVDHIYFAGETGTKYKVYAAGEGIISEINYITDYDKNNQVINNNITITIKYCDTITLVNAIPGTASKLITNVTEKMESKDCKTIKGKHEGTATSEFCAFNVNIPVKADDVIATTNGKEFPEIWALNYKRQFEVDVDWERYNSPYYQYAFCFFDMYPKDLKDYYYQFFGLYHNNEELSKFKDNGKESEFKRFEPRTIEPRCGKVMQNVNGTIKGDWFGIGRDDKAEGVENIYDLALIEDNQNPRYERIVIGGNINQPSLLTILPKHSGNINRAFEEVTPDGKTYCYDNSTIGNYNAGGWWYGGKIVLNLVDDHNLKIEKQNGVCNGQEILINPKSYNR